MGTSRITVIIKREIMKIAAFLLSMVLAEGMDGDGHGMMNAMDEGPMTTAASHEEYTHYADDHHTTTANYESMEHDNGAWEHGSDDGECGCTCLTAEEKQRWLDTMEAYEQKLAEWTEKFNNY